MRRKRISNGGRDMTICEFDTDQEVAASAIERWRLEQLRQYLPLGGYAGTGKSTMVCHFATSWPNVAVATLCGKAASVLIEKGVDAQTIHSLIYFSTIDSSRRKVFRRR